jgi:AraC family transcriptional regulator
MTTVRIPARAYAVFTHEGHISTIRRTWMTIFGRWFATSGYESDCAPEFERYDHRFDANTGNGAVEIWIPVKPKV